MPTEEKGLSVTQWKPLVAGHTDGRHQVELGLQQWLKPRGGGVCTVEEAVDLAAGRSHLEAWGVEGNMGESPCWYLLPWSWEAPLGIALSSLILCSRTSHGSLLQQDQSHYVQFNSQGLANLPHLGAQL